MYNVNSIFITKNATILFNKECGVYIVINIYKALISLQMLHLITNSWMGDDEGFHTTFIRCITVIKLLPQ